MSELIDNSNKRKELLKQLILQLHSGVSPEAVRGQLVRLIGQVPYGDVVQIEQELINDGLPQEEVLNLCDVHTTALRGQIDLTGMKEAPAGHPVHTFSKENEALEKLAADIHAECEQLKQAASPADTQKSLNLLRDFFTNLWDVDKHYRRKEYLLFPMMEKKGITGPPKVMWGKHDQTRALLKGAIESLKQTDALAPEEAAALCDLIFRPAAQAVSDMILKESQILFPMCMDLISDSEWYDVSEQSPEIGFCLVDPAVRWVPQDLYIEGGEMPVNGRIVLPTGSFDLSELTALFNTLPFDLTFVDKEDTVRFFSLGPHRIFDRNRTILGRKVQLCHPPSSVHLVQKILDDFRANRQNKAEFWINMGGKFIYISYYAMRDPEGAYLGTVEVTLDLTPFRQLEGERRLLQYETTGEPANA
jgi:DUF438 domain-containing protein